jgi:M6 family metalloprotease-like protein
MKRISLILSLIISVLVAVPAKANDCKLDHKAQDPPGYIQTTGVGFPTHPDRLIGVGKVTYQVIFVTYPDAPNIVSPKDLYKLMVPKAEKYFEKSSYNKLDLKFNANYNWIVMNNPSTHYNSREGSDRWLREVMVLADGVTDFSQADAFVVVSNPYAIAFGNGYAYTGHPNHPFVAVDGKQIKNGVVMGADFFQYPAWQNLVHEAGHNFGFIDHAEFVYDFSPMGWSTTTSELLGWEKWNRGWISDNKVVCVTSDQDITLSPIGFKKGLKMAVLPLSRTEALVVELRKKEGYDKNLEKSGVIIYKVDSSITTRKGAIQVLNGQKPLKVNKSLSYGSATIKVLDKNKVQIKFGGGIK